MTTTKIIGVAQDVNNGALVHIEYRKPAEVYNQRNFLKSQNVPEEKLPSKKTGGNEPSIVLVKVTTYDFNYDERPYFRQVLEEQAQNLNPIKDESEYAHVRGMHYTKDGNDYVRWSIREDRIKTTETYLDESGKVVKYKDIEKYLKVSARRDYTTENRQDGITSTGKRPEVLIRPCTLKVENIATIEVK
jgi:hypothetical protein